MERAGSETKGVEQGLSSKGLREQVKGVELFSVGNDEPSKGRTWQVYVSGGPTTSDDQQAGILDVERG